jgi:shikimate dehydrogenase
MEAISQFKLGLVGHPISHSLSQNLHLAALKHSGLAGSYDLFDIEKDKLIASISQLVKDGIVGFNVTIPYKQTILPCLADLSDEARMIGAVNTVQVKDSLLYGYNTDIHGFICAIKNLIAISAQTKALILGSGGAARAAVCGLFKLGLKEVDIYSRNKHQAQNLCFDLLSSKNIEFRDNKINIVSLEKLKRDYDLLINATPIGLIDQTIPEQIHSVFDSIKGSGVLLDMVYKKTNKETTLVELARLKGLKAEDGINMLVEQAALSFKIWTGQSVNPDVMKSCLEFIGKI